MSRVWMPQIAVAMLAATAVHAELALPDQLWSQDSLDVAEAAEPNDRFGAAIAAGDFNNDGFQDLAVGSPGDGIGANGAGLVQILYGSLLGPAVDNQQLFYQGNDSISDTPESNDNFGSALAAGDFNGDDFDDLAIGVPNEDVAGPVVNAGAIHVLYGSVAGLLGVGSQYWDQNTSTIQEVAQTNDGFGQSFAVGDFNGDTIDDLAIGASGETIPSSSHAAAGCVHILYGTIATGLTASGNLLLYQGWSDGTNALAGEPFDTDRFGFAIAAGNFDGDAYDDLAVGVPGEVVADANGGGVVHVVFGSFSGLTAMDNEYWHQNLSAIPGTAEDGDSFGYRLAAGDFNNNGIDDVAIGVPNDHVDGLSNAGSVQVLLGTTSGLGTTGNQSWSQNSSGVLETAELSDVFGNSIVAADFNGDSFADLAIGVFQEKIGTIFLAGAVHVLYGGATAGLSSDGNQLFHQDIAGVNDVAGIGDSFGSALGAGDFNGDGHPELVVGVPDDTVGGDSKAGLIQIFTDLSVFIDGFEVGDLSNWSSGGGK